jgi:hypothetical protein
MSGHEKPRMPRTRRTSLVNRSESRTGKRSSKASSDGSCVQPSIGMPFARLQAMVSKEPHVTRTHADLHLRDNLWVSCQQGKLVRGHPLLSISLSCMIRLEAVYTTGSGYSQYTRQILTSTNTHVPEKAVFKNSTASIEPVYYGVCVLLHRRSKYNQRVPSRNLIDSN